MWDQTPHWKKRRNGTDVSVLSIDDHSRYVLHSRFYDNQEESIVEDTFHKAILKAGKFDACYFDNGSQYIARQLRSSLSRLGITIRHAPVRSGKSKGYDKIFFM
ncbi:transposase [Ruminococcus sp. AM46-18]|nr:transposase [Ruminococcus sp. AM46-18]